MSARDTPRRVDTTVETWPTPLSRDGTAEKVFLAVRTPDDTRALAVTSTREDIAWVDVRVDADGNAHPR